MHFATRVRTWRVARLYSVLMTSQNTDLSSWYALYKQSSYSVVKLTEEPTVKDSQNFALPKK
jgi:hypothetical protein